MEKQPPWPPFDTKDCSQAYCSYYCPQWCFFYFPPPTHTLPKGPTHTTLSPLLISIIAISSTALIVIAYYLILSRYRANEARSSSLPSPPHPDSWFVSHGDGLDETTINKIALHRYQTGGGLVLDGSDCSVCLAQFEDGDALRLLPKCGHAFHATCIDRWLTSHTTCPLCRAGIFPAPVCNSSSDDVNIVIALVENVGDRRGALGRSFSMDSPFRRQRARDVADATMNVNSSGWSRSLHSVISPVRMKRASSMRYTTGVGRSRVLLPT